LCKSVEISEDAICQCSISRKWIGLQTQQHESANQQRKEHGKYWQRDSQTNVFPIVREPSGSHRSLGGYVWRHRQNLSAPIVRRNRTKDFCKEATG
jgi:hypothetical protein